MKNILFKLVTSFASLSLLAAITVANTPSVLGLHQPVEPKKVKELKK